MTGQEKTSISRVVTAYAVEKDIDRYLQTGQGLNWESFCIYDEPEPGIIFEGATKLPDNSQEAIWIGVQHWCNALSEIRRILPDADWSLSVDDHEIEWNAKKQAYDPS